MSTNDVNSTGPAANSIPEWMRSPGGDSTAVTFLDLRGHKADLDDSNVQSRIAGKLGEILEEVAPETLPGPALIKVHVGEPESVTSLIPGLVTSTVSFLRSRGVSGMALGDTTVLYSGPRGGRENPHGNEQVYLNHVRDRGWAGMGVPYVVMDRPATSVEGMFEFDKGSVALEAGPPGRYPVVNAAGAIASAGTFIQHAHMTGHPLAGLACCIKGIAMGVSNRRGKAQMHLALRPVFHEDSCDRCGNCADQCPESALDFKSGEVPELDEKRCLGCGQCMAECEQDGAIKFKNVDDADFGRGILTVHSRMTDFAVGMMQGLWNSMVHVAHLVRMTPGCDCFNKKQNLFCDDVGFLAGRNPFAVERAAEKLVLEQLESTAGSDGLEKFEIPRRGDIFSYARETYGIVSKPDLKVVPFR